MKRSHREVQDGLTFSFGGVLDQQNPVLVNWPASGAQASGKPTEVCRSVKLPGIASVPVAPAHCT